MAMHEIAEHIEHAKGDTATGRPWTRGGPSRAIGITMALLGVMLAFCAAMVGAARTELIATMVEQSNKLSAYQAESMKSRVMEADVEMLHAMTPTKSEVEKFEKAPARREARLRQGRRRGHDQELKDAIALASRELADVLTPDPEDESHLKNLAKRYEHDSKEAKEDAECYDDKIEAHFYAAEWYERAQLAAEIGIVIASVALLLASRAIWHVALVFAIGGAGIIARTYVHTSGMVADGREEDRGGPEARGLHRQRRGQRRQARRTPAAGRRQGEAGDEPTAPQAVEPPKKE